jgi:hypothetical protein
MDMIIQFLKVLSDFWPSGSDLFLFCDKHPYPFEANYLKFTHEGKTEKSELFTSGYYPGDNFINVITSDKPHSRRFCPILHLPPSGRSHHQISCRISLVQFYESNTLSYIVPSFGNIQETSPNLWSSESINPPRSFIITTQQ